MLFIIPILDLWITIGMVLEILGSLQCTGVDLVEQEQGARLLHLFFALCIPTPHTPTNAHVSVNQGLTLINEGAIVEMV